MCLCSQPDETKTGPKSPRSPVPLVPQVPKSPSPQSPSPPSPHVPRQLHPRHIHMHPLTESTLSCEEKKYLAPLVARGRYYLFPSLTIQTRTNTKKQQQQTQKKASKRKHDRKSHVTIRKVAQTQSKKQCTKKYLREHTIHRYTGLVCSERLCRLQSIPDS